MIFLNKMLKIRLIFDFEKKFEFNIVKLIEIMTK
jgi:hypothetical protein